MAGYECPLCGHQATRLGPHPQYPRKAMRHIRCGTCGDYFVTVEAEDELRYIGRDPDKVAMIAWVVRERAEQGDPIMVFSSSYEPKGEKPVGVRIRDILETMVPASDEETIDRALQNLHWKAPDLGDSVAVDPTTDYPLLFAKGVPGGLTMAYDNQLGGL